MLSSGFIYQFALYYLIYDFHYLQGSVSVIWPESLAEFPTWARLECMYLKKAILSQCQ